MAASLVLDDPRLKRFHDYWQSRRRGDLLPGRKDIDPLDIPDLLPRVSLLDVIRAGDTLRYRFRLVGTAVVRITGREHTGAFMDAVFEPHDVARLETIYRAIVETHEPHYWQVRIAMLGGTPAHLARLMVPLATDGRTVDLLMAVFIEK